MDDLGVLRRPSRRVAEMPTVSTKALEAVAQRADSGMMMKMWLGEVEGGREREREREIGE